MKDLYGNEFKNIKIDKSKIILLDLNYTLIRNAGKCHARFPDRIKQHKYERELIDMIKDNYVILITARPEKYKEATLKHIEKTTGFVPDDSYWNRGMTPPKIKEYWLDNSIFPEYGDDPSLYYGIESNPLTRAMYKRKGIKSNRKEDIMAKYMANL